MEKTGNEAEIKIKEEADSRWSSKIFHIHHPSKTVFKEGAEYGYSLALDALSTAEARNKRLMELLEAEVKGRQGKYIEGGLFLSEETYNQHAEAAWQQYKQSNNL